MRTRSSLSATAWRGLTAARDLGRAGCESFLVLEARNRVGGGTYNHDLGRGMISEAGGQWIGPGQTAIADLARELGQAREQCEPSAPEFRSRHLGNRQPALTLVVAGAGFAGVETVGAINDFIRESICFYPNLKAHAASKL